MVSNLIEFEQVAGTNNIPVTERKQEGGNGILSQIEAVIDPESVTMFDQVFESKSECWEVFPDEVTAKELYEVWRDLKIDTLSTYENTSKNDVKTEDSQTPIVINIPSKPIVNEELYNNFVLETIPSEDTVGPMLIENPVVDNIVAEIQDILGDSLTQGEKDEDLLFSNEELFNPFDNLDIIPKPGPSKVKSPLAMSSGPQTTPGSVSSTSSTKSRKKHVIVSPFKSCLVWPTTPPKTNKNYSRRKLFPSVVSSEKWKRHFSLKEEEKTQKAQEKGKKQCKESDQGWICKICDASWRAENQQKLGYKWINCDICKCTFHFRCIPKYHRNSFGLETDSEDEDIAFRCHLCRPTYGEDMSDDDLLGEN